MDEHIRFLHDGALSPIKRWGTKWSLWPVHLVTACCGVELAHAYACGYDGERLGSLNYGIARQTNLIIVEGAITRKMARVLRITWEQMPDPKFVLVMGACGLNGGLFWNGYNMVKPSDVVPVDYFIPGCPPTPEALLRAIRALQDKILSGRPDPTARFEKVDLRDLIQMPETPKLKRAPTPPLRITKAPPIKVDISRDVNWDGKEEALSLIADRIGEYATSITVTGKGKIHARIPPERWRDAAYALSTEFDHVRSVNVIDVPHEEKFIVEYAVSSYTHRKLTGILLTLFTEVPRDNPVITSLSDIWPSADYMEREMYEFFGVWFEGNEWMGRKFLLAPDTPEFPLRKDFELEKGSYVIGREKR